jgi:hypothetical protein
MSAPITKHAAPQHPDDDPGHPIPSLAVLDVVTILKGGGADLYIVVASPLAGDTRSLTRLRDKIEGYLRHIQSREFRAEAGVPSNSNTTIKVVLHPDTAPEVYELLDRSRAWVEDNNASLKVEQLDVVAH